MKRPEKLPEVKCHALCGSFCSCDQEVEAHNSCNAQWRGFIKGLDMKAVILEVNHEQGDPKESCIVCEALEKAIKSMILGDDNETTEEN